MDWAKLCEEVRTFGLIIGDAKHDKDPQQPSPRTSSLPHSNRAETGASTATAISAASVAVAKQERLWRTSRPVAVPAKTLRARRGASLDGFVDQVSASP